jgi:O-antigen/teichoic acid export membrane protein
MRQTVGVSQETTSGASARQLSTGSAAVAVGLGVFGLATFIYMGVVGRDLGPRDYAPVSLAFTLVNALGLGLFAPVEQEVSRLMAGRRASGEPAPSLRHVLRYLGLACLLIALVSLVASGPLARALLAGERSLVPVTAAALAALGVEYLVRGTLSGSGRFLRYGAQLGIDGGARAGLALLVAAMGWGSVLSYSLVLVIAPLLAAALTLSAGAVRWLRESPTATGPQSIAPLVAVTVASQLVANAGALAIGILAGVSERAGAGSFVSAITVGRIPLFLFAAVQAVFLPTLSGFVARSAVAEFRRTLRLALWATVAVGAAGVVGVAVIGEWVLHLVYGPQFTVAWLDLVLIALSGGLFMIAQACSQALLAHRRDMLVLAGWVTGLVATIASLWLPIGLTTRVAVALSVGAAVSAVFHGYVLASTIKRWGEEHQ